MRIAITADLHWGHNRAGDEATQLMLKQLQSQPPELLLLGGDIGTNEHFAECLQVFRDLPGRKALVPGNHDLWVATDDPRGDSWQVYQQHLPALCEEHGYHYLDHAPLILPEANLAIVGNINWYDYSWSLERMKAEVPNWQWHLKHKAFTRGRHNDGRFIRWPTDDVGFTRTVTGHFADHLAQASARVERVLVMTHHPAFRGISFPQADPVQGLDALLWQALSGNQTMETILEKHAGHIALIFSGHTHRGVEANLGRCRGFNIGGDYHFKRMLTIDWPSGTIETSIFGDPNKRR
jgi:3',5'-cyclic AMP phosphodiesterase CpdA